MPQLQVNGFSVEVNAEGFLVSPNDWTPQIAEEIARLHGVELTDRHWDVINFCRDDFAKTGESPGVRRVTKQSGVPTKEVYKLFPGGPGKLAAKLAGLPKPTSCV